MADKTDKVAELRIKKALSFPERLDFACWRIESRSCVISFRLRENLASQLLAIARQLCCRDPLGRERDSTRIKKDIGEFDLKYPKIAKRAGKGHAEILDLALRYRKDAEFFLGKKDYVTAFGAINYGFGLMDAIEKMLTARKPNEKQPE